jgi:CHAP domain-containing protein
VAEAASLMWWEQAYPGAPMVKVAGFPRPLYPPDANQYGKQPSVDGPDVVAYKRTVSRAGRWEWGQFDDSFSNAFSHGKAGGNVGETGIAGVQRQQHLDATGWVGEKTFNTLRSIVIPEGLPHAGEMAMDATAVNLIEDAYDRFKGSEPPPSGDTLRQRALEKATSQLGYTESPAGSNNNKFGSWYGMNGVPWCAIFVSWCFEQAGGSPSFKAGSMYSYCPYVVSDARANRNGLQSVDDPIPGDAVCYDWAFDTIYDHIGIFERWTSGTSQFNAIEGNTSVDNNSNGGEVMRRSRSRSGQGTVFIRVAEP